MTTTIRPALGLAEFLASIDLTSLRGLTVVLDLDNTTLRYNDALSDYIFTTTGRRVPQSCPSYSFAESQWFTTQDEFFGVHAEAVASGMFATMTAYDGAPEMIAALRAAGVTVKIATYRFITGSEDWIRATTLEGLQRNAIEFDELHFVKNKYEVHGDVYIDDAPYAIESFDERGLARIVFDQEYNRQYASPRAAAWTQIPALLADHALVRAA